MKKKLHLFLLLLFCISLSGLYSCEEDIGTKDDSIEISEEYLNLVFASESPESKTITFTANPEWIATPSKDWVKLSSQAGMSGIGTITITLDDNTTTDDRTAEVNLKAGMVDVSIKITQKAKGSLTLSPGEFNTGMDGEVIEITLITNLKYAIEIEESSRKWITQIKSKGLETHKLKFQVSATDDYSSRIGKITIHDTENEFSEEIKIYQSQKDAIIISDKNVVVLEGGDDVETVINHNVEYEVVIPTNVSWVTVKAPTKGLVESKVTFIVEPNTSDVVRDCKITVINTETKVNDILSIEQNRANAVIVSQTFSELTNDGGNVEIEVAAAESYEVEIPQESQSWISEKVATKTATKATTSNTIQLDVKPNTSGKNRSASITISQGDNVQTFDVYQSVPDAIVVSEEEITTDSKASSFEVAVKSDIDYEITFPTEKWITLRTLQENSTNRKLEFYIDENDTHSTRVDKIIIKDKNSGSSQEIVVTQMQLNAIVIGEKTYNILKSAQNLSIAVSTNVGIEVVIPETIDWVTYTATKALEDKVFVLKIDENISSPRVAKIAFKNTKTGLSESITINQRGDFANFIVLKNSGELASELSKFSKYITDLSISGAEINEDDFIALKEFEALVALDISETLTKVIPSEQFRDNKIINEVILPDGLTTIGGRAFAYSGLTSIKIPTSVVMWEPCEYQSYENYAFSGCENLTSVELPEGLTSLGNQAFNNTGLTSVRIPTTIKTWYNANPDPNFTVIGAGYSRVFANCKNLISVELPEGLTSLGGTAFMNTGLTSVKIPSTIKQLPMAVFGGCRDLVSVELPEGLTSIDYQAFMNCENLVSVELPEGLTSIGYNAFMGSGLTSVRIPTTITTWGKDKDSVNQAFMNCENLVSVELPEGLTSIGSYAFYGSGLTSVRIPTTMTTWNVKENVGNYAFGKCLNLTSVELPEGLTSIGDCAFHNIGLTSVKIPTTITKWGFQPFNENLTSVELTEGLNSVGVDAFSGADIKFVTIPSTVSVIGDRAFGLSSLLSVTLLGTTPPKITNSSINSVAVIIVPAGSESAYRGAEHWSQLRISDGKEPIVVVENQYNDVIWHSQTLDVMTASNRDVEVVIPANADWITYTPTRSMEAKTYTLSIAENPRNAAREANITFKDKQSNESQTVLVVQSEKVDDNVIVITQESGLDSELSLRPKVITDLTISGVGIDVDGFNALKSVELTMLDISKTATTFIPDTIFNNTITELILPENLTDIGLSCGNIINLESITLPKELLTIAHGALYSDKLTSIVLPAKLTSLAYNAIFSTTITTVTSLNPNPPVFSGFSYSCPIEVIYVPAANIEAYKSARGWREYANIIQGI